MCYLTGQKELCRHSFSDLEMGRGKDGDLGGPNTVMWVLARERRGRARRLQKLRPEEPDRQLHSWP